MPRSRYRILNKTYPHFLTATINHWQPLFTRTETVEIVLDSWRFLQQESGFEIYGYVILENHLHLITSSPDLSRDMQRFKSYTAKRIIDYLEQTQAKRVLELLALFKRAHKTESQYQVWEEGSHPQLIESETGNAPEAGLYPSKSGKTRVCRFARTLALFKRTQLFRARRFD